MLWQAFSILLTLHNGSQLGRKRGSFFTDFTQNLFNDCGTFELVIQERKSNCSKLLLEQSSALLYAIIFLLEAGGLRPPATRSDVWLEDKMKAGCLTMCAEDSAHTGT